MVASAVGRPLPTRAANGDPVLAGGSYVASAATQFDTTGAPLTPALMGFGSSGNGLRGSSFSVEGVIGFSSSGSGIAGLSDSGVGAAGTSHSSYGVLGTSTTSYGVYGIGSIRPGVVGRTENSTGVQGYSGDPAKLPAPPANTGVYGHASETVTAIGVRGRTTSGRGVQGEALGGIGVRAVATSGTGVLATATTGVALRATGRVLFDDCAGLATIASGTSSVVVTPGIALGPTSAAVATLQGNPAGTTTVKSVSIDATADTLTIHLTGNATSDLSVAWHVFG
jgi:hypothetical protein